MNLLNIPSTAFPALQQLALREASLREDSLAAYLELAESVQHILRMRVLSLNLLCKQVSASTFLNPVLKLLTSYREKRLDHHGTVYGLYFLGAYKEASDLVEDHFGTESPILFKRIEQIKTQLCVNAAEMCLKKNLDSCLVNEKCCRGFSTRIKRSGSLFAKLVTLNRFNLKSLINLKPKDIKKDLMPYDLVGGSILINAIDEDSFIGFTKRICLYFSKVGIPLMDQKVYCSHNIQRKSLVGMIKIAETSVPFQLHIWDKNAERFEFLSYGNYKMNKLFYPVLPNWELYLEKDISPSKYSELVVSSYLK